MSVIEIGITGASGRMGKMLIREVIEDAGTSLSGALVRKGNETIGRDAGHLVGLADTAVTLSDDARAVFGSSAVVIDFTTPKLTAELVRLAAETSTPMVIGTTGLERHETDRLVEAGSSVPIVFASNTSLGVVLLSMLTERVATMLGDDWDIEISEAHHRYKVDAPSGTALTLGAAAARGRQVDLDAMGIRSRDGITGPRKRGQIGFSATRGGNIVGDHTVMFATEDERLEITHRAGSRAIFARGALHAAKWVIDQPPGLYSMADVLGL